MRTVLVAIVLLLLFPKIVFAIDIPVQTSPTDGSTVTTTTMTWEVPSYSLYSGDHYRVQVDDDQNFTSINKDYNPNNNSYTPTGLAEGTWYWKVKAKDSAGTWSDWSSSWSFILVSPSPTPTPTPTSPPTPTPTDSPTSTPTSTRTPTPIKTPTPITTPTPKPTIAPTKVPTKSPTPSFTRKDLPSSILGTSASASATPPAPTAAAETKRETSLLSGLYTAGGAVVILLGLILGGTFIVKNRSKNI